MKLHMILMQEKHLLFFFLNKHVVEYSIEKLFRGYRIKTNNKSSRKAKMIRPYKKERLKKMLII